MFKSQFLLDGRLKHIKCEKTLKKPVIYLVTFSDPNPVPANRACFKRSKKELEASEAVPDAQVVKAPSKAELPTKQARKGRRAKAEVTSSFLKLKTKIKHFKWFLRTGSSRGFQQHPTTYVRVFHSGFPCCDKPE